MDQTNWWQEIEPEQVELLKEVWIPVGVPGYAGIAKAAWRAVLDGRFGPQNWRIHYIVRGTSVPFSEAIKEYEAAYRHFLRGNPALVRFLTAVCGNVYDDNISNVYDDSYEQPHTAMNHYQDISVRRVIAELVEDDAWPDVVDTAPSASPTVLGRSGQAVTSTMLTDLTDGQSHQLPRARGFRGAYLLQIRDPLSPGFCLNPAVVPVHDPALITSLPNREGWFHKEGCAHLSVEAFWQMSKVIEVRYDRFLALGPERANPLAGL